MGDVVQIRAHDVLLRFREWWPNQDSMTQEAIREIVMETPASMDDAQQVLEFLNLKAGRNYRAVPVNLNRIRARIRESSVADCKAVIVCKCREWGGDERMEKYLRPATLFAREKFEQYLGELG